MITAAAARSAAHRPKASPRPAPIPTTSLRRMFSWRAMARPSERPRTEPCIDTDRGCGGILSGGDHDTKIGAQTKTTRRENTHRAGVHRHPCAQNQCLGRYKGRSEPSRKPLLKNKRDRRNFVNGIRSRNEIQEWTSYFVTAPNLCRDAAGRGGSPDRSRGCRGTAPRNPPGGPCLGCLGRVGDRTRPRETRQAPLRRRGTRGNEAIDAVTHHWLQCLCRPGTRPRIGPPGECGFSAVGAREAAPPLYPDARDPGGRRSAESNRQRP